MPCSHSMMATLAMTADLATRATEIPESLEGAAGVDFEGEAVSSPAAAETDCAEAGGPGPVAPFRDATAASDATTAALAPFRESSTGSAAPSDISTLCSSEMNGGAPTECGPPLD